MSDLNSFGFGQTGSVANAQIRNKVLRNTYALLALSMVPTVIGAWLGVAMGFKLFEGSPFMGFVVFMAVAIGFFWAINRNKDSGLGVVLLLAFTLFMGVMLSRLVGFTLGTYSNGATLIMGAFGGTALIFTVMASIATVSKRDFTSMSKFLMIGVLLLIVAMVANMWLQMHRSETRYCVIPTPCWHCRWFQPSSALGWVLLWVSSYLKAAPSWALWSLWL